MGHCQVRRIDSATGGVSKDPEKISALTHWPHPQHYRFLKMFLRFTGYYRQFVCGYSAIIKPLDDLTKRLPVK